jgi:ribonuclease P protein subunit RPR2
MKNTVAQQKHYEPKILITTQQRQQPPKPMEHNVKMDSNTKQIAKQRITILIQQAKKTHKENPKLSQRYIEHAQKIAMAARIRLPTQYKHQICKKCNTLFVHGENCRVRIKQKREPHTVITCLNCGHKTRIPLKKKKEKTKPDQNNHQNETPRTTRTQR